MEIIKLGSDSYKISLSAEEAKKYDFALTDESKRESALTLQNLIDTVKKKEQIDMGENKICAQIYLSKDGGCEVFISKAQIPKQIAKDKRAGSQSLYRFDTLDSLLSVCARLEAVNRETHCCIYHSEETGAYYLLINGIYTKELKYAFLCEFGTRIKNNAISYISEHCKTVCENNALEIFSKLL